MKRKAENLHIGPPDLSRVAEAGQGTRRAFIVSAVAFSALAWTGAAWTRVGTSIPRIGVLFPWTVSRSTPWRDAFRRGLQALGWKEGKSIAIEYRYANGKLSLLPELAADLVRLKVDVIVASVSTTALAARKVTNVIPIVMAAGGDLVAAGLVDSLARPGGNVTGLSQRAPELAGKRLELLKELDPSLSRVAVLWNPRNAASPLSWKELQAPAQQLAIELHSLKVRNPGDFSRAFEAATKARARALFVMPDPLMVTNARQVADLAIKSRLPSIFHISAFADAGGLITYGPDRADLFRRAASYVDRILKGAKPGELPIDRATKFELVINMKTAKTLGLSIPQSVLVRADRVIE